MNAVITIPCYREEMSREEKASLIQCGKVFGDKYDVVFFVPEKLDCSAYLEILPHARPERFEDKYFASVSTYSWLLLTPEFYRRFETYEYMLLYQLDAWAFRDELEYWCRKGYDYIGAPFVQTYGNVEEVVTGNGGFSLRKISAMLRVLNNTGQRMFTPAQLKAFFKYYIARGEYFQALKPLLRLSGLYPNTRRKYLEQIRHEKNNSEDKVFTFMSKEFTDDGLTMPSIEEAALFSLDIDPKRFFQRLPFGCHAWMKGSAPFWKEYIPVLTEEIKVEK